MATETTVLKMRLAVTPAAAALLDEQSRIHGWWHNYLVEEVKRLREQREDPETRAVLYSPYGLRNLLTAAKEQYPFLRRCWTYSLQAVALRMRATIETTRAEVRKKRGLPPLPDTPWAGWPAFHRWSSQWASLEYHRLTGGFTLVGRTLTLSFGKGEAGQIRGSVQLIERLPAFARPARLDSQTLKDHLVRGLRITREHGVYYAIFTVRRAVVAAHDLGAQPRVVSLDPHHYSLAVAVDTEGVATRIPYPPGIRVLDRRIDQLKARRDTCRRTKSTDAAGITRYTPSARWRQFDALIQREQRRREARITQYLYEVANWLCKRYDVIAIGDYAPGGPATEVPALNRWTRTQSLVGRFRQTLAWVCRRSGRGYLVWNERDTTRTCHECGYQWTGPIPTQLRYYTCPGCARRHRRNENNARNGLRIALGQLHNPLPGLGRLEIVSRRTYRSAGLVALGATGTGAGADALVRRAQSIGSGHGH